MTSRRLFPVAFLLALLPHLALAQNESPARRVTFKHGRATIKGVVKGYGSMDYVFPVGAGESLKVVLKSDKPSNYFNVTAPGAQDALFIGSVSGDRFEGVASVSGDYALRVYLMRNAARRGATAHYALTIALGGDSKADAGGRDFADGLTGGPDYWEVTGVAASDRLKMRAAPSPKARAIADFADGAALKNLGCKYLRGQRWCQVQRAEGAARGWVNGRYLREGAGPNDAKR